MPFTPQQAKQRNPDFTDAEAELWAKAWNGAFESCMESGPREDNLEQADGDKHAACEIQAFRIANAAVAELSARRLPAILAVASLTPEEEVLLDRLLSERLRCVEVQTSPAHSSDPNATDQVRPHTHQAMLDDDGNGVTDFAEGHRHVVREWEVLEARGHDHEIPEESRSMSDPRRFMAGFYALPDQLLGEKTDEGLIRGEVPIQICKVTGGVVEHEEFGEFEITHEDLQAYAEVINSGALGRDVSINWEHAPAYASGDPSDTHKAAGWVRSGQDDVFVEGDGLFAWVEWTERGYESVKSGEFGYTSPEIWENYVKEGREPLGPAITDVAITNNPFLKGMQKVAATESGGKVWVLSSEAMGHEDQGDAGDQADPDDGDGSATTASEEQEMKELAEALGLSEDATEEQILEAVQKLSSRNEALANALTEHLGLDELPEDPDELVAATEKAVEKKLTEGSGKAPPGMKLVDEGKLAELSQGAEDAAEAKKELREMKAEREIRKLKDSFRITTKEQEEYGEKLYLRDPEQFEEWAKTLPVNEEAKRLSERRSHGQEPELDPDDEDTEAGKFLSEVQKIAKEETDGHYGEAIRLARQRNPQGAEAYAEATSPKRLGPTTH